MSDATPTPRPWRVKDDNWWTIWGGPGLFGRHIANVTPLNDRDDPINRANAIHIVECVNAHDRLESDRAALLAAAKQASETLMGRGWADPLIPQLDAAIAQAERTT